MAGVLGDGAGRVLLSQRLAGQPMPQKWEFPGGKLEPGEDRLAGLSRELAEELGITLVSARPLIRFRHVYPRLEVELDFWKIDGFRGEPRGRQGQALRWVAAGALGEADLLEADRPVVTALALPDQYLITGEPVGEPPEFLARLDAALGRGIRLVQLRAPRLAAGRYRRLAAQAFEHCQRAGARLLLNGEPGAVAGLARELGAAGIHVPARHLARLRADAAAGLLVGASCHDRRELDRACAAGVHFAVLGPVRRTGSHDRQRPLGWRRFAALVDRLPLPVYALGGMRPADLARAWAAGAQGVAAISALWGA